MNSNSIFSRKILSSKRQIGLLSWYFVGWLVVVPLVVGLLLQLMNAYNEVNLLFFTYVIGALVAIYLALPLLKAERKVNFGDAFRSILIVIGLLYLANIVIGGLISVLTETTTSANQEEVSAMFNQNMVLQSIATVIFAPILEEIVFRGVIFRDLRDKYGFMFSAIVSGVMFGLMHVLGSLISGDMVDVVYIVLYAVMGVLFSKIYDDTQSIYAPIVGHALYNGLSVLLMFLV